MEDVGEEAFCDFIITCLVLHPTLLTQLTCLKITAFKRSEESFLY
jgi:hypothetical protein